MAARVRPADSAFSTHIRFKSHAHDTHTAVDGAQHVPHPPAPNTSANADQPVPHHPASHATDNAPESSQSAHDEPTPTLPMHYRHPARPMSPAIHDRTPVRSPAPSSHTEQSSPPAGVTEPHSPAPSSHTEQSSPLVGVAHVPINVDQPDHPTPEPRTRMPSKEDDNDGMLIVKPSRVRIALPPDIFKLVNEPDHVSDWRRRSPSPILYNSGGRASTSRLAQASEEEPARKRLRVESKRTDDVAVVPNYGGEVGAWGRWGRTTWAFELDTHGFIYLKEDISMLAERRCDKTHPVSADPTTSSNQNDDWSPICPATLIATRTVRTKLSQSAGISKPSPWPAAGMSKLGTSGRDSSDIIHDAGPAESTTSLRTCSNGKQRCQIVDNEWVLTMTRPGLTSTSKTMWEIMVVVCGGESKKA
ncbi:hypothetical protein FA95DRAFT_1577095 [Auriscalpium vulgare]|uniref:Uncharacterized protein n=1 Tax=Auriscalpium vulgare TaxID=40419 RepID=A0ACB8R9E2_9AGAM|nr:hypothetical protein FA95DRAFT_1577095 [Auriscalpium vulgare]